MRVPAQALLDGNKVLVLKDGALAERRVDLGLANWEFSEVRSGLQVGEKVVTSLELEGVKAGVSAVVKSKP